MPASPDSAATAARNWCACSHGIRASSRCCSNIAAIPPSGRSPSTPNSPRAFRARPKPSKSEKLAVVFLATPAGVSIELAPGMLEAGAKVVDLSGAFRLGDAATYSRWYKEEHGAPELFRRSCLRTARILSRPHRRRAPDRQPGLLSHRRESRHPTPGRGRRDRPRLRHRVRCEVRRQRRGPQGQSQYQLLRSNRKFLRLFGARPPARARDPDGLGSSGSRTQLHGAPASHRSWNSGNHLFPRAQSVERRGSRRNLPAPIPERDRSFDSTSPARCPTFAPSTAPISATSASSSIPRPDEQWWSARSTISSKAPPAKPSRT